MEGLFNLFFVLLGFTIAIFVPVIELIILVAIILIPFRIYKFIRKLV